MRKHSLIEAGWRFAWGHGRRRLGSAEVRRSATGQETRTLRLSRHLVDLNDESAVREIILHEIAHALAGLEHGHGPAWRETCRRLGAAPRRLADAAVQTPAAPLAVWCPGCRQVIAGRFRRIPATRLARSQCRSCGPASLGKLRCGPADRYAQPSAFVADAR